MRYLTIPPPPILAPWVKTYWILEGDTGDQPLVYRLMADGYPELVIQYQNLFSEVVDGKTGATDPVSLIQGPSPNFRETTAMGKFGVLGVCFYPFAFKTMFGFPAVELNHQFFDINTLLGQEGSRLEEQVVMARGHEERIQAVSSYLQGKLDLGEHPDIGIQASVHELLRSRGGSRIEQLAQTLQLSRRQFERNFKAAVGIPPKLYARIARFQAAVQAPHKIPVSSLSDIAYYCGYADQSHFIREFKTFSGISPRQYFNITDKVADTFVHVPD